MKLVLLEEAQQQFEEEDDWWRENRDAKELFVEEFSAVLGRISSMPLVRVRKTGLLEEKTLSAELHHARGGRGIPGFDEPVGLREVWPNQHEAIDRFRHTGYDFPEWLK